MIAKIFTISTLLVLLSCNSYKKKSSDWQSYVHLLIEESSFHKDISTYSITKKGGMQILDFESNLPKFSEFNYLEMSICSSDSFFVENNGYRIINSSKSNIDSLVSEIVNQNDQKDTGRKIENLSVTINPIILAYNDSTKILIEDLILSVYSSMLSKIAEKQNQELIISFDSNCSTEVQFPISNETVVE